MARASLATVRRALARGEIHPVYYLTGDEDLLKDEVVGAIVEAALDPANRDFNLDVRAAGDLDVEKLNSLVETPPMLAERRVAIVRNVEQWRKNSKPWRFIREYLQHPSPTTTLVLVHGPGQSADAVFANAGVHVTADVPKGDALRKWLTDRAAAEGVSLEDEAADFLIATVGASPSHLAVEILKLSAAAVGDVPIRIDVVERYVGVRRGETVADWVDAVMQRDTARAVSLLDIVLPQPGVSGVRMLMTVGTELIGTRLARALRDAGRPPRAVGSALFEALKASRPIGLGAWGAVVERWSANTRNWTGPQLDDAIRAVYEADQQLKNTTLSDERGTIGTMVLQLSATKEAA